MVSPDPTPPTSTALTLVTHSDVDEFSAVTVVNDDHALIQLAGELDSTTRHHVDDALAMLGERGTQHFKIDVTGLTFVGAAGVYVIARLIASYPHSIVTLAGASPTYLKMLQVTGIDAHLALVGERRP